MTMRQAHSIHLTPASSSIPSPDHATSRAEGHGRGPARKRAPILQRTRRPPTGASIEHARECYCLVEVVVVAEVAGGVEFFMSFDASWAALAASVFASAAGFSSEIALPRLSGRSPVIFVFRSVHGMSRLCDTCAAATNCPRLRKPALSFWRSVPVGNSDWRREARFVLCAICWLTRDWPAVPVVAVDCVVLPCSVAEPVVSGRCA